MKKLNKKGFTLIEMLVVIAIIAILVAIIIPTVSSATEKAREATDAANIRSAYSEVVINALTNGEADSKDVTLTQKDPSRWVSDIDNIAGVDADDILSAANNGVVTVACDADGSATIAGIAVACS